MTTVVDLGCCFHDGEGSIERLVQRYEPDFFYGFDPLLEEPDSTYADGNMTVRLRKQAAWVNDGFITLGVGGFTFLDATVMPAKSKLGEWSRMIEVPCFDFAVFLNTLPENPIVKMNIEGAEFPLLEDLHERGADSLISVLHVSWHEDRMVTDDFKTRREFLEANLRCPVERWWLWPVGEEVD